MVVLAVLLIGLLPIEAGPLAIVAIFAPHLALTSVPLLAVAFLARSRRLAAVIAGVAVVFVLRFGGEWESYGPVLATGSTFDVATWNVEAGALAGPEAVGMLIGHPVDIAVLEELTPEVAAAIEASATLTARWPHRAMFPREGVTGMGLLSGFPITDATYAVEPVRVEARVTFEDGDIVVLGAHPFPAGISRMLGVPTGFDPTVRNADLELLRARVNELEVQGERVLLIGDFNTAPTEPAFARLTGGLEDAHARAGSGPGWTWRPRSLAGLGIGVLRIDLILSTSSILALSTAVDCPRVGDHCLLTATLLRT